MMGAFYAIGGLGLFAAVAVDFCSVIGRHVGHPLSGSIELMQACIVVACTMAIVAATVTEKHAAVHMLIDRLRGSQLAIVRRMQAALFAVFFLALTAGSLWLIHDLAGGHEESELLHIPIMPLRALCALALIVVTVLQLLRAVRGVRE